MEKIWLDIRVYVCFCMCYWNICICVCDVVISMHFDSDKMAGWLLKDMVMTDAEFGAHVQIIIPIAPNTRTKMFLV